MGQPAHVPRGRRAQDLGLDSQLRGRILLTTSNFPRWAGDSTTPFILNLAQDLQALGWWVDVLAPHGPGAALEESLDGVSVERFRYAWPERHQTVCYQGGALVNLRRNRANFAKLPLLVLAEWAAIARRLTSRRYDLLHSHWVLPQGFTGVLAAKPLRVPHVVTVHGSDVFALNHPLAVRAKAFALRHADAVTVNSSATSRRAEQIAPRLANLARVPMGVADRPPDAGEVDRLRRSYRRGDGPLVVFVGRLVEQKGVGDLIDAVAVLAATHPDTTALIVGEGPDRPAFEALSQGLGLTDRVAFVGWAGGQEVVNHMAAGDVFVGPSRRGMDGSVEAQGLTFAEAMLAGTPVVATASGGIPDTVRHEETGLVVAEASPRQIADAVGRLVREPSLAARLRENARRHALAHYTRRASAMAFSELFEGLVTDHKAAAVPIGHC